MKPSDFVPPSSIPFSIRTWEMDRVAKSGIAAHWSYKEGKRIDENISKKFAWIRDLVENQENFLEACIFDFCFYN